jgi:hypothetical protein
MSSLALVGTAGFVKSVAVLVWIVPACMRPAINEGFRGQDFDFTHLLVTHQETRSHPNDIFAPASPFLSLNIPSQKPLLNTQHQQTVSHMQFPKPERPSH